MKNLGKAMLFSEYVEALQEPAAILKEQLIEALYQSMGVTEEPIRQLFRVEIMVKVKELLEDPAVQEVLRRTLQEIARFI